MLIMTDLTKDELEARAWHREYIHDGESHAPYDVIPPKYPGTWNVWQTTSRSKMRDPFNPSRASHKQILTNEIGDYAHLVDRAKRREIEAAIKGLPIRDVPWHVHYMVCPICMDKPEGEYHQPSLFGD